MAKKSVCTLIAWATLILLSSCNLPGGTPTNDAPSTAVAQTLTAIALNQSPTPSFTPSPAFTQTPAYTPTPTATSTPTYPYLILSQATNCRTGPGKNYDLIDTFYPGQTIEALAQDPFGEYWYVRSPNTPSVFCWMWGYYASGGNLFNVAVFTPPPSPTPAPNFDLSFAGMDTCVGWWARFKIVNNGPIAFKSIAYLLKDKDNGETISDSRNSFDDNSGCLTSSTIDNLDPGNTTWISTKALSNDPTGHKLTASIKLCSDENLGGACVEKIVNFTP